jgi:hypothetical protein
MKLFPKLPELSPLQLLYVFILLCVIFFTPRGDGWDLESRIFFNTIVGGIGFFAALYCIKHLRAKKRTEAMRVVAERLEMKFEAEECDPSTLGLDLTAFFQDPICTALDGGPIGPRRAFNLIKGTFEDTDAFIFDYHYQSNTPSMISWRTNTSQTVIAFKICRKDGFQLPQFTCTQERFYHIFANVFSLKDIDFEQYPEFSEAYRLIGEDADSIRKIFNETVIRQLEAVIKQRWHVDAAGEWLLIHRYNKIIKPKDCPRFLSECTTLLSAMTLT